MNGQLTSKESQYMWVEGRVRKNMLHNKGEEEGVRSGELNMTSQTNIRPLVNPLIVIELVIFETVLTQR